MLGAIREAGASYQNRSRTVDFSNVESAGPGNARSANPLLDALQNNPAFKKKARSLVSQDGNDRAGNTQPKVQLTERDRDYLNSLLEEVNKIIREIETKVRNREKSSYFILRNQLSNAIGNLDRERNKFGLESYEKEDKIEAFLDPDFNLKTEEEIAAIFPF